jgi:hypothetical protein
VHQPELDLAEALSAELGRQVRRPQAAPLDLVAQRRDRAKPSSPSSSNTVSSGQTSARTNSSIQSSLRWNSGSVEKSHAIGVS